VPRDPHRRLGALALAGAALILLGQAPAPGSGAGAPGAPLEATVAALEASLRQRDVEAYLGLWDFPTPEAREVEKRAAAAWLVAELNEPVVEPPRGDGRGGFTLGVQVFSVSEPRARLEQWQLALAQRGEGWAIMERESLSAMEGLVHLSLDPAGFRAGGLSLHFEDFELRMHSGTLFSSPPALGPTALVFVGEGTTLFEPRPATEKEQLRQFSGKPALAARTRRALVRIHPADLHRVLRPVRLEADPEAESRLPEARRFWAAHSARAFVLDSSLPRSPWWLLPGVGDSATTFETADHGTLTFTVNSRENEGISLFERSRRRQICLYPPGDGTTDYNEDVGRPVDVLSHDLRVRFDPGRFAVEGEDTLRLRLDSAGSTLRLRLDDSLGVESVTSREAGTHVFFRVRDQDSLMVSLGSRSGFVGEMEITVRYRGLHPPTPLERDVIQGPPGAPAVEEDVFVEEALVYANRTAWYPQAAPDDYATARLRLRVPRGYLAVTGGAARPPIAAGEEMVYEYVQDRPAKYVTAAVGKFVPVGRRDEGPLVLHGFGVSRTRAEAARMLDQATAILKFYEEEFGPCPYPELRLVLAEARTPGGHSPPGMVLVNERPVLLRSNLKDDPASFSDVPGFYLAHELAHQWWGQGLAGQNYRERWISEAFAQYAAALWSRHRLGDDAFRRILSRFARWALRETDEGPIHLGQRLGHLKSDAQIFRAVVYNKGALVLHMLRGVVGEESFRGALRSLQSSHRFSKVGTEDLRQALEEASGRSLGAYLAMWVYGTEVPDLEYRYRLNEGGMGAVVDVRSSGLPGPVPLAIDVVHASGSVRSVVTLAPEGGSFRIETPSRARAVEINEDRGLLARVGRS
jgi:hypothetical protein